MNSDVLQWPDAEERQPQPHWQQRQAAPDVPRSELEMPPALVFPADRVYVPYDKRNRPEDLIFFRATQPALGATYTHLNTYSFDQHHGQFITLFYPFMWVQITGRGLGEIAYAIISRKCALIREWHKDFYDPPTRDIPLIKSITITPMGEEPESPGEAPNH